MRISAKLLPGVRQKVEGEVIMPGGGDRRSDKAHVNHVGNALWEYRVMNRMTQRELAEEMYICQQTISEIERGRMPINEYVQGWLSERGVNI